jgi:flagellar motor switch protein FliG
MGQSSFVANSPSTAVPAALPLRPRAVVMSTGGINDEVAQRMNIQSLRDELTQMFISQPKVARDVFSRILREDGIEFSAKCVSVLGEIMVFDLLGDDDVKKEVALLAEYIHVNAPVVGDSEQLSVLRSLKLKLTAGKIRHMTQRAQDTFDFLKSFSGRQIYDLICDESARSQAVVLTQLPTDKRRSVFELFEGSLKSALLRELCIKETLPREYLFNVAMALKRKIEKIGASGGEMLGGADVIIDLVERSERESQLEMLENLDRTNPELARQVRSRFVSVETLAYLSDGLLLEIFLALEPQVMVTFLAGTRDKIRQLILRKAPDEIADDWNESASNIRGLDSESFRLAEMQVLSKIRSFAASGLINLNEINEVMYPRVSPSEADTAIKDMSRRFKISSSVVA